MPIARTLAPSAASGRGGKAAHASSAPMLDEDAEIILFTVGNRGELPGEYSGRPLRLEEEQPESPYWATWGF